jgi:hypothetical protein
MVIMILAITRVVINKLRGDGSLSDHVARLEEKVDGFAELMDAKFVTFTTLLKAQSEQTSLALNAADKAITKSEIAYDKRFDLLNELREDVASKAQVEAVDRQVDDLKSRLDKLEATKLGEASKVSDLNRTITLAIGAMTVVISIIVVIANILSRR